MRGLGKSAKISRLHEPTLTLSVCCQFWNHGMGAQIQVQKYILHLISRRFSWVPVYATPTCSIDSILPFALTRARFAVRLKIVCPALECQRRCRRTVAIAARSHCPTIASHPPSHPAFLPNPSAPNAKTILPSVP